MDRLNELLEALPEELERQVFMHASWTERRDERAWRRWIYVLGRSRAQHATLPASSTSLPCTLVGAS
jgi:hypothetical protein